MVTEIARLLGQNGIWVDQVTTLDPHPLPTDAHDPNDPIGFNGDLDIYHVQTFTNVLFADNYYEQNSLVHGAQVTGAFNIPSMSLSGAYVADWTVAGVDLAGQHQNVHLWYEDNKPEC